MNNVPDADCASGSFADRGPVLPFTLLFTSQGAVSPGGVGGFRALGGSRLSDATQAVLVNPTVSSGLATMQVPLATTAAANMRSPRTAHIICEMTLDLTDEKAALLMLLRQTVERSP